MACITLLAMLSIGQHLALTCISMLDSLLSSTNVCLGGLVIGFDVTINGASTILGSGRVSGTLGSGLYVAGLGVIS